MYGLKPVHLREERHTSGAKALINPAIYGTAAEAVPFVQSLSSACKAWISGPGGTADSYLTESIR
jgi:hypothetical protein